ncbi:nucleoid-associated protein [Fulvivirga sp. M361]|uniref:nucleoid-associated protein n=1 Tax=Fulvivirga sp. M361 TaxID=2594266 RepID=UPI001179B385|nr:nucleoid-associated protein [Fulvivirga sp. M361]TRX53063.1 nucleoid-associated protein [Fulvivirga sp. M361]
MNFSESKISQLVLHTVGNTTKEEPLILAEKGLFIDPSLMDNRLRPFLLQSICQSKEVYSFFHETDLRFNEVFQFTANIFNDPQGFLKHSQDIAKQLYSVQTDPKIKKGHLMVFYVEGIIEEGNELSGLGIFKLEDNANFLTFEENGQLVTLEFLNGVNLNDKIDKSCFILNTEMETGFKIFLSDARHGSDTKFWIKEFLQIGVNSTDFSLTNKFLGLTKDFIQDEFPKEFNVERPDQADLLNRSLDFFKNNEEFQKTDFENEVLGDEDLIDSFQRHANQHFEEEEMEIPDSFQISANAVKSKARVFKSVLKLDKNFHVYIHGNRELIEKGVDEQTGRKFYKIYFDEER